MKSSSNEKAVLLIVTVIGVLGVVALLFNAVSGDMTGQATSALKISKAALAKKITSCTDSDGGQNYFIGGIATFGSTIERDYCLEEETEGYPAGYLSEAYCENNLVTHEIINCEEYGLDCITVGGLGECGEQAIATTSGGSSTVGGGSSGSGIGGSGLNLG